jgi:hypothetical protein
LLETCRLFPPEVAKVAAVGVLLLRWVEAAFSARQMKKFFRLGSRSHQWPALELWEEEHHLDVSFGYSSTLLGEHLNQLMKER